MLESARLIVRVGCRRRGWMTVTTEASQCHTEDDSNFCSNCCPLLVIAVINNRDYCFNCCRRLPFHPFPPFLITACLPVISNTLSLSRSLATSIASLSPFCTTYHCHTKYGLMFFHTKKTIILSFFLNYRSFFILQYQPVLCTNC